MEGLRDKEGKKEKGERNSWMAPVETCGLFLSGSKQPGNNHTLSGIPDAKIFHVTVLNERVRSHQNRMCEDLNLVVELALSTAACGRFRI